MISKQTHPFMFISLALPGILGAANVPPCSLNGQISNDGSAPLCICDKPWSGPECSTMKFKPVTGYGMSPNLTSWGGNAIQDPKTKKFHILVSAMTNGCPLADWGRNSRIDHGVADTVEGPYSFVDVAIPTWAHNSAPIALKDGTYAIVHIGTGTGPVNGGRNCTSGPPGPPPNKACRARDIVQGWECHAAVCAGDGGAAPGQCGADLGEPKLECNGTTASCAGAAAEVCATTVGCAGFGLSSVWEGGRAAKLFSKGMTFEANDEWNVWTKVDRPGRAAAASDEWAPYGVGNAVPIDHGVVLPANRGGSTIHVAKSLGGPWLPLSPNTLGNCNNPAPWVHPNGTIYCLCGSSVLRSESISGPWTRITSLSHSGGPDGNYEDPFLYTDDRGWHLLYHVYNTHENPPHGHECVNATVSAHAFSVDGFTWHMSPVSPYGTQVELTTGETVTVATRERPKMWFDANGKKTHLFNGVSSAPNCPNGPATGCVDCKYASWDYTLVQPLDV